ncbi:MAG: hypothetical protein NTX65_00985 [Ignavibacteriales bacterium]|nr:hypothetical protein [Ignavibacteriales bacterium]
MKINRMIFVLIIFFFLNSYAQENQHKFQVDFNEIKGELNSKDLYKKDFGKYDGYKIELFKGEAVNFVAYSKNFQPSIALVDSKGEIFKQSTKNDKGLANIVSEIPSDGNWVLYVIGDEKALGTYTLQTAIAEPNALYLDSTSDFCTTLDFLLSHAKAYFFLLENPNISRQELVRLNEAKDAYIDEESGSYKATFENDNEITRADAVFNNTFDKIKLCLGDNWQLNSTNWQKAEDYKEKSKTFIEKNSTKPRYVKVTLYDYADSKQKFEYRFTVDVEINRK